MEALTIDPATLDIVFDKGQGGAFKPCGLFKFVISEEEPVLDTANGAPHLPEGITMNQVDDFHVFNAMDNKRLYVFNLSHSSPLLIERALT